MLSVQSSLFTFILSEMFLLWSFFLNFTDEFRYIWTVSIFKTSTLPSAPGIHVTCGGGVAPVFFFEYTYKCRRIEVLHSKAIISIKTIFLGFLTNK